MFVLLFLIIVIIFLFYKWGTNTFDYFEKRGIPYRQPVCFLGNVWKYINMRMPITEAMKDDYNYFKNEK
jgi:hypothetical protein